MDGPRSAPPFPALFEVVSLSYGYLTRLIHAGTAEREKEEFLNSMSHELRTPLSVIVGYAGLIRDGMMGETNREQARALEKIRTQSSDLLAVINRIFAITALEAGTIKLERRALSLRNLLEDLRSSCKDAVKKAVALTWDYPPDLPVVKSDPVRLTQILQNLIGKAIEFTDRGSVTISARYLSELKSIMFRVAGAGVEVSRADTPLPFDKKFLQAGSTFSVILPANLQDEGETSVSERKPYAGKNTDR